MITCGVNLFVFEKSLTETSNSNINSFLVYDFKSQIKMNYYEGQHNLK